MASIFGLAKRGLGLLGKNRAKASQPKMLKVKPKAGLEQSRIYKMKSSLGRTEKILKDTAERQERIVKELKKRTEKK